MKILRILSAALALALIPATAYAQQSEIPTNIIAKVPSGFLPAQAMYCSTDGVAWTPCRPSVGVGDANGSYVINKGASNLAAAQVSVGTGATLVAAARTGRSRITVSVGAANTCAFSGSATVTLTTGYALQPVAGASRAWEYAGPLYGVCSAATVVSEDEIY